MDEITDQSMLSAGFHKPYNIWMGPDQICCWMNQDLRTRSWALRTGPVTHYVGITKLSDLVEKYRLVTGVDLKVRVKDIS